MNLMHRHSLQSTTAPQATQPDTTEPLVIDNFTDRGEPRPNKLAGCSATLGSDNEACGLNQSAQLLNTDDDLTTIENLLVRKSLATTRATSSASLPCQGPQPALTDLIL